MNAETLKNGGIGVLASDTIYGIMGSARNIETVERIYKVRGRDRAKPFIVLIPDIAGLTEFGIKPNEVEQRMMERYWPGKVTFVLNCLNGKYMHLHRGSGTIAFRVPADEKLRTLLKETGPLVAPSANPEGKPPAETIAEARAYFGDTADFYEDSGKLTGEPSTLIRIEGAIVKTLRQGAVEVTESTSERI